MSDVLEEWTTQDGMRVRVLYEEFCDGPREYANVGSMACWHRRHSLGDEQPSESPQEFLAALPDNTICVAIWMYEHSGISVRPGASFIIGRDAANAGHNPFSDGWDSGVLGFIYLTPERAAEVGLSRAGEDEDEYIAARIAGLKDEINEYDDHVSGQCYRFVIEHPTTCDNCSTTKWEYVESCGGYHGFSAIDNIKAELPEQEGDSNE